MKGSVNFWNILLCFNKPTFHILYVVVNSSLNWQTVLMLGSVAWKNMETSQNSIFCGYIAHYNSKLVETTEWFTWLGTMRQSNLVGFWGFHPYMHLFSFSKLFVTCCISGPTFLKLLVQLLNKIMNCSISLPLSLACNQDNPSQLVAAIVITIQSTVPAFSILFHTSVVL